MCEEADKAEKVQMWLPLGSLGYDTIHGAPSFLWGCRCIFKSHKVQTATPQKAADFSERKPETSSELETDDMLLEVAKSSRAMIVSRCAACSYPSSHQLMQIHAIAFAVNGAASL